MLSIFVFTSISRTVEMFNDDLTNCITIEPLTSRVFEPNFKRLVQEARMSRSGISFATAGMGLSYFLARQLRSGSAATTTARIAAPAVDCHFMPGRRADSIFA